MPTARQREFIELDCAEALFGGPTRCGKTAALVLAALRFSHVPGYSALILRRTFQELKQPDGPASLAIEWLAGKPGVKWNQTEMEFRLACHGGGESRLKFGYMDGPIDHLQYQGGAYQFFGLDECTHWREPNQYLWLYSRMGKRTALGDLPTRFRLTANPGGPGHSWVKARFGLKGIPAERIDTYDAREEDTRVFIPGRLNDNPGVDIATTRRNLRKLSAAERAQLEDGDWDVVPGGVVFTGPVIAYEPHELPRSGLAYGIGVDIAATPGGGDWSVAVVLARQWVPDNGVGGHFRFYVIEIIREQVAQPEFGKTLKLLYARYPTALRRAYVAGGDIVADQWMRTAGVNIGAVPTGRANKLQRALPVAAAWNGREPDPGDPADKGEPARVWMPKQGPNVLEATAECRGFKGDDKGHDDFVDALAAAFDVLSTRTSGEIITTGPRRETAGLRTGTGLRGSGW